MVLERDLYVFRTWACFQEWLGDGFDLSGYTCCVVTNQTFCLLSKQKLLRPAYTSTKMPRLTWIFSGQRDVFSWHCLNHICTMKYNSETRAKFDWNPLHSNSIKLYKISYFLFYLLENIIFTVNTYFFPSYNQLTWKFRPYFHSIYKAIYIYMYNMKVKIARKIKDKDENLNDDNERKLSQHDHQNNNKTISKSF